MFLIWQKRKRKSEECRVWIVEMKWIIFILNWMSAFLNPDRNKTEIHYIPRFCISLLLNYLSSNRASVKKSACYCCQWNHLLVLKRRLLSGHGFLFRRFLSLTITSVRYCAVLIKLYVGLLLSLFYGRLLFSYIFDALNTLSGTQFQTF